MLELYQRKQQRKAGNVLLPLAATPARCNYPSRALRRRGPTCPRGHSKVNCYPDAHLKESNFQSKDLSLHLPCASEPWQHQLAGLAPLGRGNGPGNGQLSPPLKCTTSGQLNLMFRTMPIANHGLIIDQCSTTLE